MSFKPEAKLLPSRPSYHRARWSTDSWTWEILSCTISITATVAVAIILFIYDEKSLPKLPYNIGLNSVVSIIGTVSKSALLLVITSSISQFKWLNYDNAFENGTLQDLQLYDDASRGPWGSFILLVNWRGLSWAKLGALVTVLSLAFDPVYQALITIEQRPRYQNDPRVTAKRAQSFEDPSSHISYLSSNKRFHLVIGAYSETRLSTKWTLDITSAILSNTSILETDPSCPTGNCIFPVFSSLGFCSNCIDITQFLQQNSNCKQEQLEEYGHDHDLKRMNCTYWLPPSSSGRNYSYIGEVTGPAIVNGSISLSWVFTDSAPLKNQFIYAPSFLARDLGLRPLGPETLYHTLFELPDGKIIPNSLIQIGLIKTSPLTGSTSTGFVHTANICALSVCAREYNVSMTSGMLRSEIVSTSYSNLTVQSGDPEGPYPGNSSYTFTFPNSTNDFTFIHSFTQGSEGSDLTFEQGMFLGLGRILEGNVTFDSGGPYGDSDSQLIIFATSLLQSGLNASTNIPKTMDRVAAAMTNHLRDLSSLNVHGQSGSIELYVRVSWPWLALPVLSVILGMILLISVMKVTRKHKLNIWKTSELALLFHGLDFSLHDTAEMDKVSEMEETAMALQVRLGQGPRGLQLQRKREDSGQDPPPFAKTLYPAIHN